MTYHLQFGSLLPYWDVLAWGVVFTVVLTLVSTVVGIAVGTAGAAARTFGPAWLGGAVRVYVELIRNTPFIVQLFFIYFGLPALGMQADRNHRRFPRDGDQSRRLFDRDHPRRHRGDPEGPCRSRRQPGHEPLRSAALYHLAAGLCQDLSGAVVADHHRHARLGGGVADFGAGSDLRGEFHSVAQFPRLRGLSGLGR